MTDLYFRLRLSATQIGQLVGLPETGPSEIELIEALYADAMVREANDPARANPGAVARA